jgi:class 3 adenylate cyclase
MSEIATALIKYIYLDIVGFTKSRSVEAQSDLMAQFNSMFRSAVEEFSIKDNERIFIPTGDGICLAMPEISGRSYDIHLRIALSFLRRLQDHNDSTSDKMRQFQVRIGINENVDNLFTDINSNRNVAGLGVNMAQRIMNNADGNQILVGQTVYEQLRAREKYMRSFREFEAVVKHSDRIMVYQYVDKTAKGLNNEMPDAFLPRKVEEPKLTKLAAHYLAHAIKNRDFFLRMKDDIHIDYVGVILMYLMSLDSVAASEANEYTTVYPDTWGQPATSISERYAHYAAYDMGTSIQFSSLIKQVHLWQYQQCFETTRFLTSFTFVSSRGMQKLKSEWPDVCQLFELTI